MTAPRPRIAIGETWFVKIDGPQLYRALIEDLTERTVALNVEHIERVITRGPVAIGRAVARSGRYRICDIKFVERITTRAAQA